VILVIMTAAPKVANGQQQMPRIERPYRGLFASGLSETGQSLVANATLGGGYDDNILFEASQIGGGGGVNPLIGQSGPIGSADGSLNYTLNTSRVSLGSSFGTMFRYFPGTRDPSLVAHGADVNANIRITRRTSLTAGQNVRYQPYMFASIFSPFQAPSLVPFESPALGQPNPPRIDQATSREVYLSSNSALSLEHNFTPRLTFGTGYQLFWSDTAYLGGRFTTHRGNAGFRYALSKGLGVRAGYVYQHGRYPLANNVAQSQSVDAGLDYNKALSFSRRTTLSFATGTSAVTYGGSTSFQATGFARLNHEIGRTWAAYGGFSRSVQFVDLFLAPVVYSSLDAGFGGLVNRRVEFQSGIWTSIGNVDQPNAAAYFDTFLAGANLSVALTTYMRLGAYYAFYRYRFDEFAFLPAGVPRNVDRQSVRIQMSLWAPLMQRARR
jgi:hypothetical protein